MRPGSRRHRSRAVTETAALPVSPDDAGGDPRRGLRSPDGQGDLRAGRGQGACGLDAEPGACPGDDRGLAGPIDAVDQFRGRRYG
jgi:hypothetical protein